MIQTQQKSEFRPQEKQILNSGYIIICDNIQEHKLTDELQQTHIYYTYTETRYAQIEYMQIIEKEKGLLKTQSQQQWDTLDYLLKATGCIPINTNTVDTI